MKTYYVTYHFVQERNEIRETGFGGCEIIGGIIKNYSGISIIGEQIKEKYGMESVVILDWREIEAEK